MLFMFQEHEYVEYDSVTKIHQDMSDAVNVLTHCHYAAGEKVFVRCGEQPASPKSG